MVASLLSHPLFPAVVGSFLAGLIGTTVVMVWIRPWWRYRRLRRRVLNHLRAWDPAGSRGAPPSGSDRGLESRRLSVALTEAHHETLPPWYRMVLARRRESPLEAARHLLVLGDTRDPAQAEKRVGEIRAALGGNRGRAAGKRP